MPFLRAPFGRLRALLRSQRRLSILSIVHAGGGGTLLTNQDLMRSLSAAHDTFILGFGPDKWVLWRAQDEMTRVEEVKFQAVWRGGAPLSGDREAALADLLARWRFDVAHVRSMLGSGPEAISVLRRAGLPVVLSFHDFTAVCPTVQLLDASHTYCAGRCTAGEVDCAPPAKWFSDITRLKHAYVHEWRSRMAKALSDVSAFVTTSPGAAALIVSHYPQLKRRIHIIEHGRDIRRHQAGIAPRQGSSVRIVVLGVQTPAKGRVLVEALARLNAASGRPFEIHLLGDDPPDFADVPGVVAHGRYEREELPAKLAAIGPSFSLLPSIWPETYSHTLTESWAAGIPVLASNLGAPAERIRRRGGGWLLDPASPAAWKDCLERVIAAPWEWSAKAKEIQVMPSRTATAMAAEYQALYRRIAL